MQVSIPTFRLGQPTVYKVVVTTETSEIELEKRYNDFVALSSEFFDEMDEPVPVPVPPKPWFAANDANFCEQRRRDLETMLRALVRNPEYAQALCVMAFLQLHKAKAPADWLKLSGKVSELISRAKGVQGTQRRKLCLEAKSFMAQLRGHQTGANGANGDVGSGERARRAAIIEDFMRQITQLEMGGAGRGAAEKSTSASTGMADPSTAAPAYAVSRVLGETDATRAYNNKQLMDNQSASIQDQDAQIEALRAGIARQRQLGLAIDNELTAQNALLRDLDSRVHGTNARINQAKRKTSRLN